MTFIEEHFTKLNVHYRLHNPDLIETWLREIKGQKIGVIYYQRHPDPPAGYLWLPTTTKADPIKE